MAGSAPESAALIAELLGVTKGYPPTFSGFALRSNARLVQLLKEHFVEGAGLHAATPYELLACLGTAEGLVPDEGEATSWHKLEIKHISRFDCAEDPGKARAVLRRALQYQDGRAEEKEGDVVTVSKITGFKFPQLARLSDAAYQLAHPFLDLHSHCRLLQQPSGSGGSGGPSSAEVSALSEIVDRLAPSSVDHSTQRISKAPNLADDTVACLLHRFVSEGEHPVSLPISDQYQPSYRAISISAFFLHYTDVSSAAKSVRSPYSVRATPLLEDYSWRTLLCAHGSGTHRMLPDVTKVTGHSLSVCFTAFLHTFEVIARCEGWSNGSAYKRVQKHLDGISSALHPTDIVVMFDQSQDYLHTLFVETSDGLPKDAALPVNQIWRDFSAYLDLEIRAVVRQGGVLSRGVLNPPTAASFVSPEGNKPGNRKNKESKSGPGSGTSVTQSAYAHHALSLCPLVFSPSLSLVSLSLLISHLHSSLCLSFLTHARARVVCVCCAGDTGSSRPSPIPTRGSGSSTPRSRRWTRRTRPSAVAMRSWRRSAFASPAVAARAAARAAASGPARAAARAATGTTLTPLPATSSTSRTSSTSSTRRTSSTSSISSTRLRCRHHRRGSRAALVLRCLARRVPALTPSRARTG
jgi:hypothetical protein